MAECPKCRRTNVIECPTCKGSGKAPVSALLSPQLQQKCATCEGSGYLGPHSCQGSPQQ
jgi:DnaJ-class molecular chaperone